MDLFFTGGDTGWNQCLIDGNQTIAVLVDVAKLANWLSALFPLVKSYLGIFIGVELTEPFREFLGQAASAVYGDPALTFRHRDHETAHASKIAHAELLLGVFGELGQINLAIFVGVDGGKCFFEGTLQFGIIDKAVFVSI
ncbi:MAG: hypothetical protein DWH88_05315 [Planctomycetota bacterium]|nr:MAG: hypothetical protein DWH88_05315 [Planctomycetota bacterium]